MRVEISSILVWENGLELFGNDFGKTGQIQSRSCVMVTVVTLTVRTLCVQRLEESLREKDKAWKEASNRLEQLTAELEQEKQLGNRRDKTIQGLVCSLHKKEKEVGMVAMIVRRIEGI